MYQRIMRQKVSNGKISEKKFKTKKEGLCALFRVLRSSTVCDHFTLFTIASNAAG